MSAPPPSQLGDLSVDSKLDSLRTELSGAEATAFPFPWRPHRWGKRAKMENEPRGKGGTRRMEGAQKSRNCDTAEASVHAFTPKDQEANA